MKRLAKATLVNALILFSIGGVAAFLFSTGMVEPRFVTSCWFGITSQSGLTLIVSAGIAAVGGAIEGARLSSLKINTLPRNRSAFEITLRALTPVLLAAILIQFVSFFSLSRFSPGAADTPNFALLFVFLLILIFHLLLGFNLGLRILLLWRRANGPFRRLPIRSRLDPCTRLSLELGMSPPKEHHRDQLTQSPSRGEGHPKVGVSPLRQRDHSAGACGCLCSPRDKCGL